MTMWSGLEKISEQVTTYSTTAGKIWYLLVFVFRMIVVVTIGQSVYSDEQSAFRCSTKVIGCDNVCYDRFSKISHIRFWAFQLLAVTSPAVLFHFYTANVKGRIEKIKTEESRLDDEVYGQSGNGSVFGSGDMVDARVQRQRKKLIKRRQSVGAIKQKKVFVNDHLIDITLTRDIKIAYFISVIFRIAFEAASLIFSYQLFHFTDYTVVQTYNPLEFLLIRVPQVYRCDGENVEWACGQHLTLGENGGYVPCWVSRPWEKTIFMCYMNVLSGVCLLLSFIEMLQLMVAGVSSVRRHPPRLFKRRTLMKSTSDVPKFSSAVDVTDGKHTIVEFSPNNNNNVTKLAPPDSELQRGEENPLYVTHMVPYKTSWNPRNGRGRSRKKVKTKKSMPVGIRMNGDDDEDDSGGSGGYHSSEYASDSEEEEQTLSSVSIPESN